MPVRVRRAVPNHTAAVRRAQHADRRKWSAEGKHHTGVHDIQHTHSHSRGWCGCGCLGQLRMYSCGRMSHVAISPWTSYPNKVGTGCHTREFRRTRQGGGESRPSARGYLSVRASAVPPSTSYRQVDHRLPGDVLRPPPREPRSKRWCTAG